jgi:hypothetical protein
MSFIEYYEQKVTTLRNILEDTKYNKTFNWIEEHRAITNHDSICIGILNENDYNIFEKERYIDYHVIPFLTYNIRKAINKNKDVYYILNNLEDQKYIQKILEIKFPNKIKYINKNKDIPEEIKLIEQQKNMAIAIVNQNDSYALKYIIENI